MRPSVSSVLGTGLLILAGVTVTSSLVKSIVAGVNPETWWANGVAGLFAVAAVPFWVLNHRRLRSRPAGPSTARTRRHPTGGS